MATFIYISLIMEGLVATKLNLVGGLMATIDQCLYHRVAISKNINPV